MLIVYFKYNSFLYSGVIMQFRDHKYEIHVNKQIGKYYYLCIRYNEKNMKIFVKNNKTFKILDLLLKPYPINKKIEIPVDMYIYKGNRYVDIENVNLTKIEGYSEAEKIVREMEKEEI